MYTIFTAIGSAKCKDFSELEICLEKLVEMNFEIVIIVFYEER